jgi:hypothetical protein
MTRLDEPPTVKEITDELCGVAVVLVAARVAAKNRIARLGPPAHDPAVPLRLHPILVIRDDGQQTAMLTGGTGFDLVYDVKWHGARLCPDVHPCRSIKGAPLAGRRLGQALTKPARETTGSRGRAAVRSSLHFDGPSSGTAIENDRFAPQQQWPCCSGEVGMTPATVVITPE